jgi:hypothetical protein
MLLLIVLLSHFHPYGKVALTTLLALPPVNPRPRLIAPAVFGGPALAGNVSVTATELKDARLPRFMGNVVVLVVVNRVVPTTVVSMAVLIAAAVAVVPPLLVIRTVKT